MSADSSRRAVEQLGDLFVYTTLVIRTSCVVNTCAEVIGAPRLLAGLGAEHNAQKRKIARYAACAHK